MIKEKCNDWEIKLLKPVQDDLFENEIQSDPRIHDVMNIRETKISDA